MVYYFRKIGIGRRKSWNVRSLQLNIFCHQYVIDDSEGVRDSRFLEECSSEGILSRIRCLTKREVWRGCINDRRAGLEVEAAIRQSDVDGLAAVDIVSQDE